MHSNIVAIVGRPNVGKSTFFNRLVERREAIVDEQIGVTRDRHYGHSIWNGVNFSVIDTGGYIKGSDDVFESEIRKQVLLAIDEAEVIVFMVDGQEGLNSLDKEVGAVLRKTTKPIFVVANKIDEGRREELTYEFYNLGLGDKVYAVSSMNGGGTGDLLDDVVKHLKPQEETSEDDELPNITIVGRPNVGKSTFTNALLGEERNIVTDISGTTRDSLKTHYKLFGKSFNIIDTAGIRKKSKVYENLEFYSVMRSVRAIEYSDVCILMIDATEGIQSQDLNIFGLIQKNRKGVIIAVNKWDAVEKETNTTKKITEFIKEKIAPFDDVPILFISSLKKQRIFKVIEEALDVYKRREQRIKTSELNDIMLPIIQNTPPPALKGKYIKIKFCTQLPSPTPQFAFFANLPQYVKAPYIRFLENQMRKNFNFSGVPITVYLRKK